MTFWPSPVPALHIISKNWDSNFAFTEFLWSNRHWTLKLHWDVLCDLGNMLVMTTTTTMMVMVMMMTTMTTIMTRMQDTQNDGLQFIEKSSTDNVLTKLMGIKKSSFFLVHHSPPHFLTNTPPPLFFQTPPTCTNGGRIGHHIRWHRRLWKHHQGQRPLLTWTTGRHDHWKPTRLQWIPIDSGYLTYLAPKKAHQFG